jgi:HSP20 family protein
VIYGDIGAKLIMQELSNVHLRRLEGRLGEVVFELTKVQFSKFASQEAWRPAINAFRCEGEIVIGVDLAGVDKAKVNLTVQPREVRIRGVREAPEPESRERKPIQVLTMEIDYGPFERRLELPETIDPQRVTAEQRNGLLWVYLPLAAQS